MHRQVDMTFLQELSEALTMIRQGSGTLGYDRDVQEYLKAVNQAQSEVEAARNDRLVEVGVQKELMLVIWHEVD